MESKQMAVEASAAAGTGEVARILGMTFWVALGALAFVGFSLAAALVMIATQPRTTREWAVALISTLASSFGLGAGVVLYLGLHVPLTSHNDIEVVLGLIQVIGAVFACGLPGWVIVRIAFNTMTKFKDKAGDDLYRDAKELLP